MLTGHIDVVPPGPREHWQTDPFTAAVADGFVQGRGAVDMKGGVASMLMAVEVLKELDVKLAGDVVFTTVVDEEIGGMGSLAMVDRGFHADAGIMTEPTANRIAPLCHGILWGRIIIDGIGGHAELTPNAWYTSGPVDAIQLCRQMLDGIDILNRRWAFDPKKNHPLMDLPNQIIVTQIKAGEHPSSMAGRGEIIIDVQYLPAEKDEFGLGGQVKREVEAHIQAVCQADPYLRRHPGADRMDPRRRLRRGPRRPPLRRPVPGFGGRRWVSSRRCPVSVPTATSAFRPVSGKPRPSISGPAIRRWPTSRTSGWRSTDLVACTKAIAMTIARWCG